MKWSSSTPSAWQASRKSSSHIPGFVSPVYLAMLVGGRKHRGNGSFWIRGPKSHGPGPSGLGLRLFGHPPCLGCVSSHSSMVRMGPAPPGPAAIRWTSSSCWAWRRLLMTLRASWFGPSHSRIGGWCGAGARLGCGAAVTSCSMPGNCCGEWTERFDWCGPSPLVGQEATSWCRDAELSTY